MAVVKKKSATKKRGAKKAALTRGATKRHTARVFIAKKGTVSKAARGVAVKKVTFNAVLVHVSPHLVRANVRAGQTALARAKVRLITPGVRLRASKNVPLYRSDPQDPARLLRSFKGVTTSGRFVRGKFKPEK